LGQVYFFFFLIIIIVIRTRRLSFLSPSSLLAIVPNELRVRQADLRLISPASPAEMS
jgi:hypothetical protein